MATPQYHGQRRNNYGYRQQQQHPYNTPRPQTTAAIFPSPGMIPNNPSLPNQQGRGPLIQQVPPTPVFFRHPQVPSLHNPSQFMYQPSGPGQIAIPGQRPHFPIPPAHVAPLPPGPALYQPMAATMGQNPQQIISSSGAGQFGGPKGGSTVHYPPQQQPHYQSHSAPKRERKAIKIINPDTKEEVDVKESGTGPGSSSTTGGNASSQSQTSSAAAELKTKVLVSLGSSTGGTTGTSSAHLPSEQSGGPPPPPPPVSAVTNPRYKPNAIISIPSVVQTPRTNQVATDDVNNNGGPVGTVTGTVNGGTTGETSLLASSQEPSTQSNSGSSSSSGGETHLQEQQHSNSKEEELSVSSSVSSVLDSEKSLVPEESLPKNEDKGDSQIVAEDKEDDASSVSVPDASLIQRESVLSSEGTSSAGNVTSTAADRHPVSADTNVVHVPLEGTMTSVSDRSSPSPPLKEKKDVTGENVTKSIDSKESAAAPAMVPDTVEVIPQPMVSTPTVNTSSTSPDTTGQTRPSKDKEEDSVAPSPPPPPAPAQTSKIVVVKGGKDKRTPELERAKTSSSKEETRRPRSADDSRVKKEPKLLDSTATIIVTVPAVVSSSSSPVEPVVSGNEASLEDSDGLEDGELPPEEEEEKEVIMNGDVAGHYPYDPDQRLYDRDFLLTFRSFAKDPPASLREIPEVFCPGGGNSYPEFSSRKGYSSRSKKVIDHKPQAYEKVDLHKAEKRWVRASDQEIPVEEKEMQELFRRFQGILNKLTPQKFTNLAVKAQSLEINTEERLNGCIDRIFKKALEEPNFSIAYANLCRVMSSIKVSVTKVNEEGEEVVVKETSFRRELLTKCQKEFEKDKKDDEEREAKLQAIEEASSEEEKKRKLAEFEGWETAARRRSLGNIRFIGELFKLKILSESIMHECIMRLLRSSSDHESLECFCRLITTTGKELDHQKGKMRMDRYFVRIADIIEKKKISSRIRFMLQDIQDLRKCDWVPRRQEGLKTIDQIHQEAELEAIEEQKMIKAMAVTGGKSYSRDDKKKGLKNQADDMGGRKYDKRTSGPADVSKILGLRKKEGPTPTPSLGPGAGLRPSGWGARKKDGQTPPPGERERVAPPKTVPQKSSSSGAKRQNNQTSGRSSQQGPRRSSSQPSEKQAAIQLLKGITQPSSQPAAVKKAAVADKLDEETLRRKTGTIIEEFDQNKDYSEAETCVNELESPNMMNVFVSEAILHSLEKTSLLRDSVGILLDSLLKNGVIPKEKAISGLKEVLDMADDLEVDIPKIWDFFAEILNQLFVNKHLALSEYHRLLDEAGVGYKSPRATARLLQQCVGKSSKVAVTELWAQSGLSWVSLGVEKGEEEDFLSREKLQFLSSEAPPPTVEDPPYLKDLVVMFGSPDTPNDDILEWIESKKIEKDTLFVRTLSRASIESCTQGEGDTCILSDERFRNRLTVVKKYVDMNEELQVEVLNAAQVSLEKLKHPPAMLSTIFWSLYDVEVVSEKACQSWRNKETELAGRGMALQTTKQFFSWLDTAEQESDQETPS